MDCKTCRERDASTVSRGVLESVMARNDRMARRLWIIILVLIFLFVGTNVYWIWYESQFEDVITYQQVKQEADNGMNRFVGGNYYGSEGNIPEDGLIVEGDNAEGDTDSYNNN